MFTNITESDLADDNLNIIIAIYLECIHTLHLRISSN